MATYYVSLYAYSDITLANPGSGLTVTLNAGATPILVKINDNDGGANGYTFSDSAGPNQTVLSSSNGNLYDGQLIKTDYSYPTTASSADMLFTVNIGNPVMVTLYGFTYTPVPGVAVALSGYDPDPDIPSYDLYVHCFTRGTAIRTALGETLVEGLTIGDRVWTEGHGMQPVRWISRREVPAIGAFAPVRIRKGALGADRDIVVSPAHRMLVQGPEIEMLFGMPKALVAAKDLLNDSTITREASLGTVEYFHILFDQHEVLEAHGTLSESFFPDEETVGNFGAEQREELFALFPELEFGSEHFTMAYPSLLPYEASLLQS